MFDGESLKIVIVPMGYELTGATTPMTQDLLEKADLIVIFETKHRNEITRVLDYNQWNKISLFNQLAFGENKDMEDPHMQSETMHKRIATQIEKRCEQLVLHMKIGML